MTSTQKTLQDITDLTLKIETDYPELYAYLEEIPMTIPNEEHPKMDHKALCDYLETLRNMLSKYIEEQQIKNPQ